jgi:acyl carrier protein
MAIENIDMALFEQLQALLAEIFEVDAQDVSAETQFGDLPKWDSMGHMDLMLALESNFGVEISAETISELISVPLILEKIRTVQND